MSGFSPVTPESRIGGTIYTCTTTDKVTYFYFTNTHLFSKYPFYIDGSRGGMSNVSTPIPIHRQMDSLRGDPHSQDIRSRHPSVSPVISSRALGLATSPLDSRLGSRPRSYSTGERYSYTGAPGMQPQSHTQLRGTGDSTSVRGQHDGTEDRLHQHPTVQRRLSLDSRLQQKSSSGASALIGDILNVDNIFNMLHLGEKSSAGTAGGFGHSNTDPKYSTVSNIYKSSILTLILFLSF